MTDYRRFVAEDVRRIILETLVREPGVSLNEGLIGRVLETHGHRKTQAYIRAELDWLARAEAIAISDVGGVVIARLLIRGAEHIERRAYIPGVAKPSLDV